jgi:hypothetical protein
MLPVSENEQRKPVVWLHGRIKTPPFTPSGRIEAGLLFPKKTQRLPDEIVRQCKQRLRAYDEACRKGAER